MHEERERERERERWGIRIGQKRMKEKKIGSVERVINTVKINRILKMDPRFE